MMASHEFYQIFTVELTPIILKLSPNWRGRNMSKLILWGQHRMISDKGPPKRKWLANITDEHSGKKKKNLHKSLANQFNNTLKNHTPHGGGITPEMQGWFNIYKWVSIKNKTYMIISRDAEKAFDKFWHSLMIKTLNTVGIEGPYFNKIKPI